MDRQRHGHRLHGEVVRRFSPQLSRTVWSDGGVDALAYSPAGFIWDNVIAHGKTLRDYGEFAITARAGGTNPRSARPDSCDHYQEFLSDGWTRSESACDPAIESLRPYLATNTVGWDFEDSGCVPRRAVHQGTEDSSSRRAISPTSPSSVCRTITPAAPSAARPTPAAQVADNDLAFGQIVEALSHSRFWPQTCIFAIEDDPQAGWDHVSGYRTTALCRQPLHAARRRGQHPIQPDQPPAHHGTDPRPAADEPDGRHRHADDRVLH